MTSVRSIGLHHPDPAESVRLGRILSDAGHAVQRHADGAALAEAALAAGHGPRPFDLLVMRWDGTALCGVAVMHRLRARLTLAPRCLLLIDEAAPAGIAEGADAVLQDPASPLALLDAVGLIGRQRGAGAPVLERHGELTFDMQAGCVNVAGHPVILTAKEFALALLLVRNVGQPLSRNQIMTSVWGRVEQPGSRTLDAHVAQVRKRLMLRPETGWRLSSVYGFGYRLDRVTPEDEATG